jgi:hypothetical protein
VPRYRERRWPKITAAYAVFVIVLAAITAFAHETVAEKNQATVIRMAVAVLVAVVLIHLRSYFRGDPLWDPPSEFADALIRETPAPKIDSSFAKLREEIVHSLASRSVFENVLWPRLRALARARLGDEDLLIPPTLRRAERRGPSRQALAALIDRIEGK